MHLAKRHECTVGAAFHDCEKMTVKKICILGLDDYPQLINQTSAQYVGGESVQHVLLAHAWRDLGLDVSIVVQDHGQGHITNVDGVHAVATYRPSAGIPLLRFAHPRATRKIAAMRQIDADVYYQSPSSADTGLTAWFCRRFGKRCVVRIASDLGCIPGQQLIRYWRDRKIYEYGLRNASLIVAQTAQQQQLLIRHYQLPSEVVNMAVEMPRERAVDQDIDVLWVANFRPVKRPGIVFELARRLPHLKFTLAGGALPGGRDYFDSMLRQARQLPNITCLGAVPYRAVGELFSRARVFLNTSSMEGFPNTFLQAWIRGVPVVTFFDPDGLVRGRQLGHTATTVDEMAGALEHLLQDSVVRRRMGERARAFAIAGFSARQVAQRYLDLLDEYERPRQLLSA